MRIEEKKMENNMACNKFERRWLESLSTRDLLYLMMMMNGQIKIDENDETQKKLKRSYERYGG